MLEYKLTHSPDSLTGHFGRLRATVVPTAPLYPSLGHCHHAAVCKQAGQKGLLWEVRPFPCVLQEQWRWHVSHSHTVLRLEMWPMLNDWRILGISTSSGLSATPRHSPVSCLPPGSPSATRQRLWKTRWIQYGSPSASLCGHCAMETMTGLLHRESGIRTWVRLTLKNNEVPEPQNEKIVYQIANEQWVSRYEDRWSDGLINCGWMDGWIKEVVGGERRRWWKHRWWIEI